MDIQGWEKMYRSGERGGEDEPTILLVETAEHRAPGAAADLACGTGRNALYLASLGWNVTGIDGSAKAIALLKERSQLLALPVQTQIADLTSDDFTLPTDSFDLVLIAYYLQRDLLPKAKAATRPGGVLISIAHIPEPNEAWSSKRAAPGELRELFNDWKVLWEYEGPSRDPAHRRPVAEIVAERPAHYP